VIWTIAKREITTRGRSKGYIATTSILFLAVIAVALLLTFINGSDSAREVTIGLEGPVEKRSLKTATSTCSSGAMNWYGRVSRT